MAPSTSHDSLYTVTPGASSCVQARRGARIESEPKAASRPVFQCQEPGSGCLCMSMSMSIVHFTCLYFYIAYLQSWQVARPKRWVVEVFSGSSCRLKWPASWGSSRG